MDFSFTGGTAQQRRWFNDALHYSRFPYQKTGWLVSVLWVDEPSAPGHGEYMAAIIQDGAPRLEIRNDADDPQVHRPPGPLRNYYMEAVTHEIGHLFFFLHYFTDEAKTALAAMFTKSGRTGTLADWNPLDRPFEDRVQEALAEFFKDVYLPETHRVFDNRTNWRFMESRFGDWLDMIEAITCAPPSMPS